MNIEMTILTRKQLHCSQFGIRSYTKYKRTFFYRINAVEIIFFRELIISFDFLREIFNEIRIICINTDEGQKEKTISICKHYYIKGASTECVIILFIKRIMLHTYTRRKNNENLLYFSMVSSFSA